MESQASRDFLAPQSKKLPCYHELGAGFLRVLSAPGFPSQPAAREGQTNSHRGGDLYLDELRFDSPERFITRARLGKLWKLW